MRTKLSILLTITMILALIPMSAFALEPVDPIEQMMYANDVEYGDALPINISSYTDYHHLRLDPANALGEFDAVQSAGGIANANFFGLAAREWTEYIFEERFCNVDWETDIQFAEVTWGGANTWHPEAAKVYLTGAMVDGELETEAYYVGIVWNRIGVNYISAADRLAIAEGYSPEVGRELATSELQTEGVIEITGFNLPAQVESAAGIRLIDITHEIFDTPTTSTVSFSTYTNGAGGRFTVNSLPLVYPNDGNVTIVDINPAGNTDGFDLDAIRVWKCVPIEEEYGFCGYKLDAETGLGLGGWTIIATDEHGEEWTTETGPDGNYCFTDLPAGTYTVEEVEENGWEQVFPGGNGMHEVTLPKDDVVYGIQRNTGKIFEIDPLTAVATEFYEITSVAPTNIGPNGLAFDQMTGNLYFTSYPGSATLYVTDGSGEEEVGDLTGAIACADFFNGKYYYIASGTDNLYEVSFDTSGDIEEVKEFPDISGQNYAWTFNGDIAISSDGVIYGFGMNSNGAYHFFKVNRDGTDFEMIKDSGYTFSLQLAFSGDGVLYGHDAKGGRFYAVDTDDGSIELISTNSDMLYTDTSSGTLSYNFENMKEDYGFCVLKTDDDTGEPIMGWDISLYSVDAEDNLTLIETVATDSEGKVCFDELEEGEYFVKETIKDGWIQILPDEDTADPDEGFFVSLPLDDGEEFEFVNAEVFDLCGHKYGLDWNGFMMDPWSTDNPLDGWTIKLLDSEKEFEAEATTGEDGMYCFEGLRKGTYYVVESYGDMNDYGFWKNGNYWRPVDSEMIQVEIPRDVINGEEVLFTDFYNMCYTSETAWMFGDFEQNKLDGLTSNNWGWYQELGVLEGTTEGAILLYHQPIYAGAGQNDLSKGYLVGYLDIIWDGEKVVVEENPEDGIYLEDMKVWIGNTPLPLTKKGYTNAPGQLEKGPVVDYTEAGEGVYVAVHFEAFVPCEFPHPVIE